jgi:hypothetical protein
MEQNRCNISFSNSYYTNFANDLYDEFRKERYGIKSCLKSYRKFWLDEIRHELLEYKKMDDVDATCKVNTTATIVPKNTVIPDPIDPCAEKDPCHTC